jgi:CDP-6-deoxy-D-xylo-4-hexulose-3-dehydrase
MEYNLPLMSENIDRQDVNEVIQFLQQDPLPKLTHGPKVREFEKAWSKWLGVGDSVFVNSGSSANQLTFHTLRYLRGKGRNEVIVPPLTWISDIAAVVQNGFKPVFCDINLHNLSFDLKKFKKLIRHDKTAAVFITHVLGINALTQELLDVCAEEGVPVIEDVCESHGATFKGKKAGSFGFASNFSFYFAHHMSTIEGGMVCTNDSVFCEYLRAFRSHGMSREMIDKNQKAMHVKMFPDLNPDFIFLDNAHNFRSTEINAVLGLSQLKKLDTNNIKRKNNFAHFMHNLNPDKYVTTLEMDGQCNYAFIVILKNPSFEKRELVETTLRGHLIEFRRGLSGGGNQMRQPYFRRLNVSRLNEYLTELPILYPNIEHVHHFSWYIGNFPTLEKHKIDNLLRILNSIDV